MSKPAHLVILSSAGWGHIRSILQLALHLQPLHPKLYITSLTRPDFQQRFTEELDRQTHLSQESRDRIQVICVEPGKGMEAGEECDKEDVTTPGFSGVYLDLCSVDKESKVGDKFRIKPNLIVYDGFQYSTPAGIKTVSRVHDIPKVASLVLFPTNSITILRNSVDPEFGGAADGKILERLAEFEAEGMEPDPAASAAWSNVQNKLVEQPGMPPMYDYEYCSQLAIMPVPKTAVVLIDKFSKTVADSDGVITFGVPEMESWATNMLRASQKGGDLFAIGPQMDDEAWRNSHPAVKTNYTDSERIAIEFLDRFQKERGENSVAFISLGTIVWPRRRPELLTYLIESIISAGIPFLFAIANPNNEVPDHVRELVDKSGIGLITGWVPQYTVLQHPALRFFITHNGAGSTYEAIRAEIPMISFPFVGDQIIWAAQLSHTFKAGIWLRQINSGMKGKPLGNGEVIVESEQAIKGEMEQAFQKMKDENEYKVFKENIAKVHQIVKDSITNGKAGDDMKSLIIKHLS